VPAPTTFPPIFTPESLIRLATGVQPREVAEAANEARSRRLLPPEPRYRDLYVAAYREMVRTHRAEYVFKNELLRRKVFGVYSPNTTAFIVEHRVGESRADAVLVNSHATAYEIKTAYDSFARAEHQCREYYRCFRRVVFVVAPEHESAALQQLPEQVGVSTLTRRLYLRKARSEVEYSGGLDRRALYFSMLKSERREADAVFGIPSEEDAPLDDWMNWNVQRLKAVDACDPLALAQFYEDALRERRPASAPIGLLKHLDPSLTAVAYSGALLSLPRRKQRAVEVVLNGPLPGA